MDGCNGSDKMNTKPRTSMREVFDLNTTVDVQNVPCKFVNVWLYASLVDCIVKLDCKFAFACQAIWHHKNATIK